MESMLYRIFCGTFGPEYRDAALERYQKQREVCCQKNNGFLEKVDALDPSLREELVDFLDERILLERMEPAEYFAEGFVMGARLMAEVLTSA